jgi:hypothetical protein
MNFSTEKALGPDAFTGEPTKHWREMGLFQKVKGEEHSPTCPMRPALPWYQNQTTTEQERDRLVSFMNIDAKTFNKILAYHIQQYKHDNKSWRLSKEKLQT